MLPTRGATPRTRLGTAVAERSGERPPSPGPGLSGKADGFSSIETARLTFGEASTNAFARDFEFFAFAFEAREDAVIEAEVTQRGTSRGLDTTMFLYRLSDDAAPSRIGSDDDGGWGALSRISDFRLDSEGLYAVVVGTRGSAGRGEFRFTLGCSSGGCAPAAPPQPTCSEAMRRSIRTCLDEVAADTDYETPMNEIAGECGRDLDVTFEYHCDGADAPTWCNRGEGTVVRACDAFLRTTYPADALSGRVSALDVPEFDELAAAAHESEGCGVSVESGCTVAIEAFTYSGDAPSVEDLFAYARARSPIGPGVGIEVETRAGVVEGLGESYDIGGPVLETIEELGVDLDQAEEGLMFQGSIYWNHGDCQIDVGVLHDASSRTFVVFDSLFCAG